MLLVRLSRDSKQVQFSGVVDGRRRWRCSPAGKSKVEGVSDGSSRVTNAKCEQRFENTRQVDKEVLRNARRCATHSENAGCIYSCTLKIACKKRLNKWTKRYVIMLDSSRTGYIAINSHRPGVWSYTSRVHLAYKNIKNSLIEQQSLLRRASQT